MTAMNAQQLISLADTLRSHALQMGHDLNASNLFVHTMLMRTITADAAHGRSDPLADVGEWMDR
jgi:hypothetical protein